MPGSLYLLTGLPYAGSNTLLKALQAKLHDSPTFGVMNALITHEDDRTHEQQSVCSEDEFKGHLDGGNLMTNWKSHIHKQTGYLTLDITALLTQKMKVVFFVPREKLPEVEKKAAEIEGLSVTILDLRVSQEILVARATAASKEDKFNDKAFLKRIKAIPEAKGETIVQVDNEALEEDGLAALLASLGFDPLIDLPHDDDEGKLNLATCSPQDYLKHVLYPYLSPALERINIERPDDPVEFLALYLKKDASTKRERLKQLGELKAAKTRFRAEAKAENNVVGRV